MRFLRTVSTGRLLALVWGTAIACAACTALALAAVGSGPVPKPRPLALAIHRALVAPSLKGVRARITFTNNLLSASYLQGSDPLLTGATGRLWAAPGHLRLELQSDNGDTQVVFDRGAFWAYDPSSNIAYEGRLPAEAGQRAQRAGAKHASAIPTVAQIERELSRMAAHLGISRAIPTDVGGRPAYRVVVSPKPAAGLIGDVQLAWDAARGVPLDFAVYARGNSTPALELKATSISYGSVSRSVFAISPPSDAKVVRLTDSSHTAGRTGAIARAKTKATTPANLAFHPVAPAQAGGRTLTKIHRFAGGALLAYGRGLGGVYVFEHPGAKTTALPAQPAGQDGPGLALPTVSIGGVSAQELPTELGTVIQFARGGVSYVVFGSVPPATAAAVARGL